MSTVNIPPRTSRRRRTVATTPVQLERLITPAMRALEDALNANPEVDQLLDTAVIWRRAIAAMSTRDGDGPAPDEALARILEAAERAADLLMADADVRRFSWTRPRVAVRVLWLIEYRATGQEAWQLGSLEAFLPAQLSRYVAVDGRRLLEWNGASYIEREALQPYFKWEAERESGRPAKWQGKSYGDGSLWQGGLEHFLEDLWATLERRYAASGTRYGHDPVSAIFRETMQARPSAKTMYKWLQRAGLRPRDVTSGKVTRGNYVEFLAT